MCLAVRHGCWVVRVVRTAINRTPIPWHAPDIFLEASAPDKLPSNKVILLTYVKEYAFINKQVWWYLIHVLILPPILKNVFYVIGLRQAHQNAVIA